MNSIINSCMKFSRYIRVSETISCIFYTSGLIDHAIQESLFLDRIIDKRLISLLKIRQPPIFPGRLQPSIVGRSELNFRVRDGNGWTLALISTNCCIATVLYSNKPLSDCQVVPSGTFKRFAQQNLAAGRIHFARGFFVLRGSRKSIAFLGW